MIVSPSPSWAEEKSSAKKLPLLFPFIPWSPRPQPEGTHWALPVVVGTLVALASQFQCRQPAPTNSVRLDALIACQEWSPGHQQ